MPLSQATKDEMRAVILAQMISDKDASITGYDRVVLIEEAILSMLGDDSHQPSAEVMNLYIKNIISAKFSPYLGDLLANAITQAIDQDLADSLIDKVALIYGDAIKNLFTGKESSILPVYTGPLADDINKAIASIPADRIPVTVAKVITDTLQSLFDQYVANMVPPTSSDAVLNTAIQAAETSSAKFTIAVYTYKGV